MPRRIEDETGVANFIDPEERKRAKPLTGSALEAETSRLLEQARPSTPLSLIDDAPRPTIKAKPTNRIGPPVKAPAPKPITPPPSATPFDQSRDPFLNPDFVRNLGAPARPNLTPSQFAVLGGAPQDFAGVQRDLAALPPEAGQPVPPPKPSGIDIDEISRDLDAEVWRDPKLWGAATAAGAFPTLAGASMGGVTGGAIAPHLANAATGGLLGAGVSAALDGDAQEIGTTAALSAIAPPLLDELGGAGIRAGGRVLRALRPAAKAAPVIDDAARAAPRALSGIDDTAISPTLVRSGNVTSNMRAPGVPREAPLPYGDTKVMPKPLGFGEGVAPTKAVAPGPVATQTPGAGAGGGILQSLDQFAGRALRSNALGGLLGAAGIAGGAALGSGFPVARPGAGPAMGANPPQISVPFATQRPTAENTPPMIAPEEERAVLKPLLQTAGITQQDYARSLAEVDGFNFDVASPQLREKYLIEASQYFDPIEPAGPLRSQPRGGVLQGLGGAAEGLDRLLKGK